MSYDFGNRLWPFYSQETEQLVANKIKRGEIYGTDKDPDVSRFEEEFCIKCAPGTQGIFCNSGTSCLLTAYFSLGLPRESEVLVPTYTFRATVTPLILLGMSPVFYDCLAENGQIDFVDLESRITPRTEAIVVSHMTGHPIDLDVVSSLVNKYKLALIEDCSHAHGAEWNGRKVGTFGDLAIFSTGTKKMISGGTGGILVTKDNLYYQKSVLFSQPKPRANREVLNTDIKRFVSTGLGNNFRGSPISAVLAQEHLDNLERTIETKNQNINLLRRIINDKFPGLKCPERKPEFNYGTWYSFPTQWKSANVTRDIIYRLLKSCNVLVDIPSGSLFFEPLFHKGINLPPFVSSACDNYSEPKNSLIYFSGMINWETREMYEDATSIIFNYAKVFEKIVSELV